jgi:hypothetical protein
MTVASSIGAWALGSLLLGLLLGAGLAWERTGFPGLRPGPRARPFKPVKCTGLKIN